MDAHANARARKRVRRQVSAVTSNVSPSLPPNISEASIPISGPSRELVIRGHSVHRMGEASEWGRRRRVTIDILPDDVLVEILNVYTDENSRQWPRLVHVCRRWRDVVFTSTRRLNLQLRCTYKTPVREILDIWPALPIIIQDNNDSRVSRAKGADNIVAALGHPDRVRRIDLWKTPSSILKRFAGAMKEPFPELRYLRLDAPHGKTAPVLPDSFLGGSAPCLLMLQLYNISFPAMPKLLSSASHLVKLNLLDIPHSGYISPEAMATGLSTLATLEHLYISFQSPRSRPDQPSPPRLIHTVLPSLTSFVFRGVSEYLEYLTSRIDAPLLSDLQITFVNQVIFNTPRLWLFISHAEKLRLQKTAQMIFSSRYVKLYLVGPSRMTLNLTILCKTFDWQLSALSQICDSPLLSSFNLEHLDIYESLYPGPYWQEDVEYTQWLELLHPFTTVKRFSLSTGFTPRVVPALQELSGDGTMDVLPALQSIFLPESSLSGPVKEAVVRFVTARQLSGHPVAVNPQGQE